MNSKNFLKLANCRLTGALIVGLSLSCAASAADFSYDFGEALEINANTAGVAANASAITTETATRATEDVNIRTEFANADVILGSRINTNTAISTRNTNRINKNEDNISKNSRGIAMVAALQHTTVLPGMTNALDAGVAHFDGETGMSLNYSRRINENVQINFGAASTTDFDESVIKAGIGYQW